MDNKKEINRLREPGNNANTKHVRLGSEKIPGSSGRNLPGNTATQRALLNPQHATIQQHHTITTSSGTSMQDPENAEDPLVIPEPLEDIHLEQIIINIKKQLGYPFEIDTMTTEDKKTTESK